MEKEKKSEMFKKAHKIARGTAATVGNYSIAFKLALKQVWALAKASEKVIYGYKAEVLCKSFVYGAKSQGFNADWFEVDKDELLEADKALENCFMLFDWLDSGQYYYAVWCYVIGQKLVDRWIKLD